MQFAAFPLKGVNDIEFGMTANMVEKRMTGELEIGDIRAKSPNHPTYYYPEDGVFFYFEENGYLEGIEFCSGCNVLVGGVNFFNLPVRAAIASLTQLDPATVVDADGAVSHQLSLGIWCPNIGEDDDEEPVETLFIGKVGYFEHLRS